MDYYLNYGGKLVLAYRDDEGEKTSSLLPWGTKMNAPNYEVINCKPPPDTPVKVETENKCIGESTYVSTKDLMAIFGKSGRTIRRWRQEKNFPSPRVDSPVRLWDKDEVVRWADSHQVLS